MTEGDAGRWIKNESIVWLNSRSNDTCSCWALSGLTIFATIQTDPLPLLDERTNKELCSLYVHGTKGRLVMMKSVVEEAMALASITLFLAMVAVWTQVLGVL